MSNSKKLRVAIVGCGQIADAHIQEIKKIRIADMVAVCDRYPDLAKQAAERFGVPGQYDDVGRMLAEVSPDVVHITTPPHSHAPLASQCLNGGANVYVEKPFTVDAAEARQLLSEAKERGRLVCVGHDQLFDPCWLECRAIIRRGELGKVVHVDSEMGYDLSGPFGRLMLSDPGHWINRLPGGLFQNNISHALYKITDLIADERFQISATWFPAAGAVGPPTELRVLLRGTTASATILFGGSARPVRRCVRVFGTRGGLEVDFDGRLLRRMHKLSWPGPFAKIEAPWRQFKEAGRNFFRNLVRFLRSDLQYFAGMNRLILEFYRAIIAGAKEGPIAADEIDRVTAIMDEIFESCRQAGAERQTASLNQP
jgi:predicted dehydrogenase